VLAALFILAIIPPVAAATGSGWPQVGGDVRHSGANLAETTLADCTVPSLEVRWTAPIGRAPQGAPSYADGRLYVGSATGVLSVHDAGSGRTLWSKALGGRLATPVVDGGRVYALSGDDTALGTLYALSASDGRELWRRSVNANGHQSPLVGAGLVVVTSNRIYGFSADTGQPLWSYGDEFGVAYEAALVDGLVVAADDGKLVALTPSGAEVWWTEPPSRVLGYRLRVSADRGVVYAGGFDGILRAVDVRDGTTRWSAVTYGEVFAPAVAAGMVYAQASTNYVFGIDQVSGAIRWSYDTASGMLPPGQSSNFPPSYANGLIFVSTGIVAADRSSLDNFLLALDAKTGALRWKAALGRERATQPTIAGGQVFIQTESRLIAYGLPAPKLPASRAFGAHWLFLPITGLARTGC
jgi:outer membrane protein assembly factor BamB